MLNSNVIQVPSPVDAAHVDVELDKDAGQRDGQHDGQHHKDHLDQDSHVRRAVSGTHRFESGGSP